MKKTAKILALAILSSSLILATGCKQTKEIGDKFIDDSKKTYDTAAKKVNDVKDATVQKVNDIQDAAKKIQDAADAVDKVTSGTKPTPTPTPTK